MLHRVLGAVGACGLAIACTPNQARTGPDPSTAEGICLSQGYRLGSDPYIACVQRETEARRKAPLGPSASERLIAPAK